MTLPKAENNGAITTANEVRSILAEWTRSAAVTLSIVMSVTTMDTSSRAMGLILKLSKAKAKKKMATNYWRHQLQ